MAKFDNHIRTIYKISKDLSEKDQWPPIQSKNFVNLMLIRHSEKVSKSIIDKVARFMQKGCLNVPLNQTFTTTEISDIFKLSDGIVATSKLILIDGAPGVGKTILSKEIAYRWACNELLSSQQLMLLIFLRDSDVLKIKSIRDLVNYMYNRFAEESIISAKCAEYLLDGDGKNITVILDGYDELKEKTSFITNLLDRKIMPCCTIVVTSRPIASARLRERADIKVEILGFTEESKQHFIHGELKDYPDKLLKVASCLKANSNLNHLCYVPFIVTVLVCLAKDKEYDELPTSQHELYEKFVVYTISHSLRRLDLYSGSLSTIDDLPAKYKDYFLELCHYAFVALNNDKIVFTIKDIKMTVPKFADAPGSWSGLGLLKSAKYFDMEKNDDCTSYNFIHLSIQEYAAAYYISTLPPTQQVDMLKNYFFHERYLNMWIMYGGLCKETLPFTHFLSGNKFIAWSKTFRSLSLSHKIVRSKLDRLYLFQVSSEFSSTNIRDLVSNIFQNNCLDLSMLTLSTRDIDTLTSLLDKATVTHWNELNLSQCYIGDSGCKQLCDAMTSLSHDLKFNTINLSHNDLSLHAVEQVINLLLACKAKVCHLSDNPIVARTAYLSYLAIEFAFSKKSINCTLTVHAQRQKNVFFNQVEKDRIVNHLNHQVWITGLYLVNCRFDKDLMDTLSDLIEKRQKLSQLYIWHSNINDNDVHNILSIMPRQNAEQVLFINGNSIMSTLYDFPLPKYKFTFMLVGRFSLILQYATTAEVTYMFFLNPLKLEMEKLQYVYLMHCKLDYETVSQLTMLFSTCKCISKFIIYDCNFGTRELELFLDNLHAFPLLQTVFVYHKTVRSNYLMRVANKLNCKHQSIAMLNQDVLIAMRCNEEQLRFAVKTGVKFTTLVLKHCAISKYEDFLKIVEHSRDLNNICAYDSLKDNQSTLQFLQSLNHNITGVKVLDVQNNQLSKQATERLANFIKHNTKLQELCLVSNDLQSGAITILKAIQSISSLKVLALNNNSLSEEVTKDLEAAIIANNLLEKIWLDNNHLKSSGIVITTALSKFSKLQELDLSNIRNKSDKLAISIAAVVASNPCFTSLILINSNLQSDDVIAIAQALNCISTLRILNLQQNQITDKAANALASAILHNTGLQKLCLGSNLLKVGLKDIAKALAKISSLKMLDLNNNLFIEEVADDLAAVISTNSLLEKVWLGNIYLGSSIILVLNALNRISLLKELNLNSIKCKSDDLPLKVANIFKRNSSVTDLRLNNNNLNFNCLTEISGTLSKISSLEVLDISSNLITAVAANSVADIILNNINLRKLYLGNNQLHTGIKVIAKSLEALYALEVLDLVNNGITRDSCNSLATAIKKHPLTELKIAYNNLQSSGFAIIATGLKSLSTLTCLQIDGINIDSAVLSLKSIIASNLLLQYISLSDNLLKESLLELTEACIKLHKLRLLGLSSNCISPKKVSNLPTNLNKSPNLEALLFGNMVLDFYASFLLKIAQQFDKLSANHLPKAQGETNHLNSLVSVSCLEVIKIQLMEYFVENYDKLYWQYANVTFSFYWYKSLLSDVIYNNGSTKQITQEAKQKLSQIDSKAMISSLQIVRTLKVINLENNNINEYAATELAGHLRCNNKLEQLWLRGNELYDKGASVVLQSLHNLSTLLILDLSFNHLSSESADGIAVVIGNNCSLQQLWLDGNDLLTKGVVIIASALKKLSSLRILSLCSNGITDDAAEEISNVVTSNVLLVDLLLGNNQLEVTGICKIAIALRKLFTLRKLDLSNNHITPDAAEELAVTLSNCTNLQQLFLNDNMLGTEGTIKIANALKCVNTLQVLTLSNNSITESAADAIVDVLKNNNISLKIILIGGNDLQTTGVNLIVQAAKNITNLQILDVSDNGVSEDEKENFKTSFLSSSSSFTFLCS